MTIKQMRNFIKRLNENDKYILQNMLNDIIRSMEEEE